MKHKEFNAIDLAKFIAALFVVAIHVAPFNTPQAGSVPDWFNFISRFFIARLAVPFFFICNGFFLFRKVDLQSVDFSLLLNYIKRIFRLYLIWSAIYFPLSFLNMLESGRGLLVEAILYLRRFFVFGSYVHLWYLSSLVFAMLFIALLLYFKVRPLFIFLISCLLYIFGLLGDSYYFLAESTPILSSIMNIYLKVFVTTVNGLFFGMLFISIGMFFAHCSAQSKLSLSANLILMFISLIVMGLETFALKRHGVVNGYNMTVFLVPTSILLFFLLMRLELRPQPVYRILRMYSSLVFYSHLLVCWFADYFFCHFCSINISGTPIRFIAVVLCTLAFSCLIIRLSDLPKFRWLKKCY